MKTCSKCKKELSFDSFVRDKQKVGGLYSQCKACKKLYLESKKEEITLQRSQYWDAKKEELGVRAKKYRQDNKDKLAKYSKQYRLKNRDKLKAHQILRDSFRYGNNVKPVNCSSCGKTKPLEAHHDDYSKPLEVTWLCRSCHKKQHQKEH